MMRIVKGTSLGALLGLAGWFVLSGFFPRVDLSIQNWVYAHQSHKDSEGAAVVPAFVLTLGGSTFGFLGAFKPHHQL